MILAKDIKDDADERFHEILEPKIREARVHERDRLHHAAGSTVLCNLPSPSGGAGTSPAGKLQGSDQLGKLISARDRRVFQRSHPYGLDRPSPGRQSGTENPE